MSILITGGAGFIGSHMAGLLLDKQLDFVIVDNLSRSNLNNLNILEKKYQKKINFIQCDLRDLKELSELFSKYKFDSVIHFAALKSVEESVSNPKLYYENNTLGSKNLINLVKQYNLNHFVFSSSCCVYGNPTYLPVDENHPLAPINPYGQTKVDVENMLLEDNFFIEKCCTTILRYFNPIGSFDHGLIGENAPSPPSNLMPYILGVINHQMPHLNIYGDDYRTDDGTAIRDYIHIMDLVEAHYIALTKMISGVNIYNVGTGCGYSVLDIVKTFQSVNKVNIPVKICSRRLGDAEAIYANPEKIKKKLGWYPKRNLKQMCKDSYSFAKYQNDRK
jgi:UDP-glucose 4-epimerase